MNQIYKYPRTQHIQGSRLQPGDEDLASIPFSEIAGRHLVIEEKMDGANAGVSFTPDGKLLLQSRGHYLTGGAREKHFDLFKTWAHTRAYQLWPVLGDRYVMYGEWLYAKHTVYYNALPHYFMEFDVLDTREMKFLDTESRKQLLGGLSFVVPVKVLFAGSLIKLDYLIEMLTESNFIMGNHIEQLRNKALHMGLNDEQVAFETDPSPLMEGLYIKVEEAGRVVERFKYVRADFLTTVQNSQSHWLNRPIIPNELAEGVSLF